MKKIKTSYIIIGLVVLIVGLFGLSKFLQSSDPNIVSQGGVHWHPELAIYVRDEKQEIPANIGISAVHQTMHTHSEDASKGVIHIESQSTVRNEDVRLGRFFEIWGKDIQSFGTNMKMTVNGKENTEFGDYILKANDKVELRYE